MNNKRRLYLSLCDDAEQILIKSGIKAECNKCFAEPGFYKDAMAPDYENGGLKKKTYGCCTGCEYVSETGCTIKCLACKLWLCSRTLLDKIKDAGLYDKWEEIIRHGVNNHWIIVVNDIHFRFVRMPMDNFIELRKR